MSKRCYFIRMHSGFTVYSVIRLTFQLTILISYTISRRKGKPFFSHFGGQLPIINKGLIGYIRGSLSRQD